MDQDYLSDVFFALGRPNQASHHRAARLRGGHSERASLSLRRDLPAVSKHLKVLQRAGLVEQPGPVAPLSISSRPAQGRGRVGRELPRVLGRELRPPGRAFQSHKERNPTMTQSNASKLNMTTPSDREIQMTRTFNAPRELSSAP